MSKLIFNLSGPICSCRQQYIGWRFNGTEECYLELYCNICSTKLQISRPGCTASIELKTPYPSGIMSDDDRKKVDQDNQNKKQPVKKKENKKEGPDPDGDIIV